MVSIKDISEACGVSKTQVSRALNDKEDVSVKTKELVIKTAKELGYVKNISAMNLATQTSKQIPLFHKGINDKNKFSGKMLVDFLKGMNEYLYDKGWEPVLHLVDNFKVSYVDYCRQRNIPGVIVMGMKFDDKEYLDLIDSDFPCVVNDIPVEGENKGSVIINNSYYANKAVDYLISKGSKRIAMLCGHKRATVTIERKAGYQMSLIQHGIEYDESIVKDCEFSHDIAFDKTIELLSNHSDIDSFFCHSDTMAIGCIKAIQSLGLKIPDDIAVFGFDDISISEFINPPLTTIRQDNVKKGYYAAKLILDIIENRDVNHISVVPCKLIERESA